MGKVLIVGKGKSGKAAASRLEERGIAVDFADGYDLVVASPGVPVKSELQYGCELLRERGVKLLAVTGSKGKSSVVKLVADAINASGRVAVACGNYGLPVSAVGDCDWAVVEVSSFQLETTHLPSGTFEAAVVLNLQEDHLDRHGSVDVYHSLKTGLLSMARIAMSPDSLDRLASLAATRDLMRGSYFDNEVLRRNGAAAVALMRVAGLDDAAIANAFASFQSLAHRMQLVGESDAVRFVDDSKATSMAALSAGVAMTGGAVRLIAGGLLKGDDAKVAIPPLVKWVKKVYLIGSGAEQLNAAWKPHVDCEICGTMERAVAAARRDAASGETVLLSPGAASFDQFNSFEERGEVFARIVNKEGQKNK